MDINARTFFPVNPQTHTRYFLLLLVFIYFFSICRLKYYVYNIIIFYVKRQYYSFVHIIRYIYIQNVTCLSVNSW